MRTIFRGQVYDVEPAAIRLPAGGLFEVRDADGDPVVRVDTRGFDAVSDAPSDPCAPAGWTVNRVD